MKIGELCAGYTGLGMGVQAVLGGHIAWVADNDPGCEIILKHRFAGPNLGDITSIEWEWEEPVDILTAGFPCQDVSCAGQRKGLRAGTRSGVWSHVARAIEELRPPLVVLENVRGLLSAYADSVMEPCPWCLGETGHEHSLRAAGAVLGDLARLGYVTVWRTVPASAAGAAHERNRVFFLAADPTGDRRPPEAERFTGSGSPEAVQGEAGGTARGVRAPPGAGEERTDGDTELAGLEGFPWERLAGAGRSPGQPASRRGETDWGDYAPAIARWADVVGRPAPPPAVPGRTRPRLSALFVEWMMGLPQGWVTDVPGLSRTQQLKALGNGVVPQQAALALTLLLNDLEAAL